MSLATTVARIGTVLESVAGVENVRLRPGLPTDRALLEETLLTDSGLAQRWVVWSSSRVTQAGIDPGHPELDVRILAVWAYREDEDTFADFAEILQAVGIALSDPVTGFPQLDENGIETLEEPGDPVLEESGLGVYRTLLGLHLLDVVST